MKLTFNRNEFVETIRHLSMVVDSVPAFTNSSSCIKITPIDENTVDLVGTDTTASLSIKTKIIGSSGFTSPVLIPLGIVHKISAHCSSDEISFSSSVDKNGSTVVSMIAGNCKARLHTVDVTSFPDVSFDASGTVSASLPASSVIDGFDKTGVSMWEGQTDRSELRGILLEKKRGINDVLFTATNGYQLSQYRCDGSAICPDVEFRSTFPSKYVSTIIKLLQDRVEDGASVAVGISSRKIFLSAGSFSFATSINERAFPDWERLIVDNSEYTVSIQVDPKVFADTIERVNAVSDSGMGSFAMGFFQNELFMSAISGTGAYHGTDSIPVEYDGKKDVYFSCNPKFFTKVLRKMQGSPVVVRAGLLDEVDGRFLPVVIEDGNYFNLILPMRGFPSHGRKETHDEEN